MDLCPGQNRNLAGFASLSSETESHGPMSGQDRAFSGGWALRSWPPPVKFPTRNHRFYPNGKNRLHWRTEPPVWYLQG